MARKRYVNTVPDIDIILHKKLKAKYPHSMLSKHEVNEIVKELFIHIKEELLLENSVNIDGFGKFHVVTHDNNRGNLQHYPRFKFKPNFIRRYRAAKGTATPSELHELQQKNEFISRKWESVKQGLSDEKLDHLLDYYGTKYDPRV